MLLRIKKDKASIQEAMPKNETPVIVPAPTNVSKGKEVIVADETSESNEKSDDEDSSKCNTCTKKRERAASLRKKKAETILNAGKNNV